MLRRWGFKRGAGLVVLSVLALSTVAAGCRQLLGLDEKYSLIGDGGAGGDVLGQPCPEVGKLSCAGHTQKLQLLCGPDMKWVSNGTCGPDQLCDTSPGINQGTCLLVVSLCANQAPGDVVCDGLKRTKCGPDLVTTEAVETCLYVCSGGVCGGVCKPGDKQCMGNTPQSCEEQGQWQSGGACSTQAPVCFEGACEVRPSCIGLSITCGPKSDESCCAMTTVPGGTFNRSNDAKFPSTVSDFRLEKFEITVGRFRKFVDAYPGSKPKTGDGAHPRIAGSGWDAAWDGNLPADLKVAVNYDPSLQTWTDEPGANENLPMSCISWYDAFAFCAWDGGRLPTEAEWNYAAAGGSEQREYPWGDTAPNAEHVVYDCNGDGTGGCALTDILKVGANKAGDSKWGQADLAGGMFEWNLDWYGTYSTPCNNCANMTPASYRVMRGGSWSNNVSNLLSSHRRNFDPTFRDNSIGARCARTP